jgi:hypothetical protein
MSSLQSQVRKIERVLVKQRAIIGAHLYTDAIIDHWQTTTTSDNPTPDILAFMAQIPGPEVHLPTEAAVIGYLEKCRRKGAAPVRSALLNILIPGIASARLEQWK